MLRRSLLALCVPRLLHVSCCRTIGRSVRKVRLKSRYVVVGHKKSTKLWETSSGRWPASPLVGSSELQSVWTPQPPTVSPPTENEEVAPSSLPPNSKDASKSRHPFFKLQGCTSTLCSNMPPLHPLLFYETISSLAFYRRGRLAVRRSGGEAASKGSQARADERPSRRGACMDSRGAFPLRGLCSENGLMGLSFCVHVS